MASMNSPGPNSPPSSLGIHITGPNYASLTQRTSEDDDDFSDSEREARSQSRRTMGPSHGIPMISMISPTSPGNIYSKQSPPEDKSYFSPTLSIGARSPFARRPDTLYSFGSNTVRPRSDSMTERLIAHRAMQSTQWKVHWRTPMLMTCSFVTGVMLAIAQHLLYKRLHHMEIADEEKKVLYVLYGRALAYLCKVAFGTCVVLVYRQRSWRTFRSRALTVLSIDHLFDAVENPSLFGNWEVLSNAPIAVMIALVFWLIPVATIIFSPGALTFGTFLDREIVNISVPNLDFSTESWKNYRVPNVTADGMSQRAMIFYNTTDPAKEPHREGWFDYYDQPSAELSRVAILLAYNSMSHPNTMQGARQAMCGGPYNCTYEQTFVGPGYQCEEVANGVNDDKKLAELGAPFNTSLLVPEGRYIYHANIDMGDYSRPQKNVTFQKGRAGVPDGPIPDDLGVFKSEPVLWIGYSVNSTESLVKDSPYAVNWTHRYDPHVMRCVHHETRYTVLWNYTEPSFSATATKREFLSPVVDTNFSRFDDGLTNEDDPQPVANFVSPRTNVQLYKKTAAYHAMGQMLRTFLRGEVGMEAPLPGPSYAQPESDITKTRLVDKSSEPKADLQTELEDFYTDMILSLLSLPTMLVVQNDTTQVDRTRYQPSFVYVPVRLWQCYVPVIFITFLILLFGFWTIWEDGTTFSTGFSRILVTTRNTTLDDISRGACLGNDPFPVELMHTKLKFGVLGEGTEMDYLGMDSVQSVGHCAFGVASEVVPIKKGVPYAGLQRRRIRQEGGNEE
ncbi:hypothetical protein P153DRAFT_369928 [Dothidotthia symphoricarpi CBS 119687]|uniref:Uncharacterized protein n=1 Tax=Dothidotthia symphoricarpi CBS 119687 TaxID=1392245 RepID=A0A6A6A4W3_9PLEO|nr:uncharacterized protein P153DRAFT_369928 [Dothidotthia symphoricarpi CBS 119687]KAF2125937.1 hypothetical protein P153DRAFT_369928 [Dothidotthia symphoricarpi CBS 119687]